MAIRPTKLKNPGKNTLDIEVERIPSGIPGLDAMIRGGFVRQSTALVRGGTGSGKTLLCLQYLYYGAVTYDEPGVYLSFAESENAVHQHGKLFGWDFKSLSAQNKFAVIRYQPHEIVKIIDEGGGVIRDTVESMGAKRLVIDSLTAYEMMFDSEYKANESILTLLEILRKWNTTSLVTSESPITPTMTGRGRLGFLTDTILHMYNLRYGRHRRRAIEVVKMRDTNHSDEVRGFELNKSGIGVSKRIVSIGKG
jgi:circadian clock protein KaiC